MNYLDQVQKGIDYIETRLDYDIEIGDVAWEAGFSQWHFQRVFKALTNETVKTYIRSRRLANSLDKLLRTDERILDIAICAGFETQESFTRAFKKAYQMTPNEYRKLGSRSLFLKKVKFDAEYLQHINKNVSLEAELVIQPEMTIVGLQTPFYGSESDKNNIGDKLPGLWDDFVDRADEVMNAVDGDFYGVVSQVSDDDAELLLYHAGVEVSDEAPLPIDMCKVVLPESRYARFVHRGDPLGLDRTVNYVYSTWLAQSGYSHSNGADLEIYGEGYIPGSDDSVIHYAIPIAS